MTPLLVGLTLAASLSPLLTFAHLFQLKEWRWDRLREHLRETGWWRLFGITRPLVLVLLLLLLQIPIFPSATSSGPSGNFQLISLLAFTLLNLIQILTKRQPYPVWTKKALTLIGTNLILTGITAQFSILQPSLKLWPASNFPFSIVLIPLLQPFFLLTSWILWKPIDHILKHRILQKAKTLRAQFPDLTVIGITGSAGKTTTKELLAHILGPDRAIATPEHVNSELGVAQWLIKNLTPNTYNLKPIFVVEMGAYREGEIRTLCSITQPTMGIITNIGTQHIGLFGSQRAIAEAKGELFAALPERGHAFLTIDTPFAQELRLKCQCPVTTVGTEGSPANMQATHVEETPEGLRFHIHTTSFAIPLHGEHQLGNALLAVAAAMKLRMTLEDIAEKLKTCQAPPHTFSLQEEQDITVLDDTHNASPESLRAAIEWARHQPYSPKILITPGIIEQGRAAARLHFQCGALAKDTFDEVYVLNKKFAQYFEQGFGKPVSSNLKAVVRDPEGSSDPERESYNLKANTLLVCVGRVPQSIIQKFLP